ncbi:MAG: hypothetical protein KGL39_12050 [Patescibacteria group bacterium]|nr:hypothetical protein [Patescibacteria group bacterium]
MAHGPGCGCERCNYKNYMSSGIRELHRLYGGAGYEEMPNPSQSGHLIGELLPWAIVGGIVYVFWKPAVTAIEAVRSKVSGSAAAVTGAVTGSTPTTSTTSSTTSSAPPASSGPSAAQIQQWANGIGLNVCIGQDFAAAYGRLPNSLDELNTWGMSSGHRHGDGSWSC